MAEKKFFTKVVAFTFTADDLEDAELEGQWILDKLAGRWYPHEDFEHLPVQEVFPWEITLNGKKFVFDGQFTYEEQTDGTTDQHRRRKRHSRHHGQPG